MIEIVCLSDEEWLERQKSKRRKSFLEELEEMTSPVKKPSGNHSFSIKDAKKKKPTKEIETSSTKSRDKKPSLLDNIHPADKPLSEDWEEFYRMIGEEDELPSPIDDTVDREMTMFRLDNEPEEENKFGSVFKKELGMLAEVLRDTKSHGTAIRKQIDSMLKPSKGIGARSAGITKNFADLIAAYNGIQMTKLSIIREMAAMRGKQVDWSLKDKKDNPPADQSVDTIADSYYRSIINGNASQFIRSGTSNVKPLPNFEYDPMYDSQPSDVVNSESGDPSEIDGLAVNLGFNPTQPLEGFRDRPNEQINGDPYGNIRHEKNPVEICVYDAGGKYQFAALDKEGEVVDDVELPSDVDPYLVDTLTTRPGSNYVYDKYGRKYRVIEMGAIDISDIDDMEYPYNDD